MSRKSILIICLCCLIQQAWSVNASPYPIHIQTDKHQDTTIFLRGDEAFHWAEDRYGNWMQQDSVSQLWHSVEALSSEQIAQRIMHSPLRAPQQAQTAIETHPIPRGLIILVNFTDTTFKTSKAEMDSMLNGVDYKRSIEIKEGSYRQVITSSGSVRKYFIDQSNGAYTPQFDVVGPVTVSREMSYYGKNNTYWGTNDDNVYLMIKEACQQADKKCGVNFAQYDNDGDGYIDFVYIIYAGYGEADSGIANTVWPHSSYWTQWGILQLDGKKLNRYACSNEIDYNTKYHTGVGTFCHEFSHVLGLPDIYDTNYSYEWKTLGQWDLMDAGSYNNFSNTPPSYSGYERFFMGWTTPRVLKDTGVVTLNELQSSNEVLLISSTGAHNLVGNDPNPTLFYLLENRQRKGWDYYLPGAGLLMTKINYKYSRWSNNSVNAYSDQGVDLIEADDNDELTDVSYYGRKKDAFPAGGRKHNIVFPFKTYSISNVSMWNQVVTFNMSDKGLETDLKDIPLAEDEQILHIYDIMGHKIAESEFQSSGVFIVETNKRTYKIIQ